MWVQRLLDKKEACWKNIPTFIFEQNSEYSILRGQFSSKFVLSKQFAESMPKFYCDILCSWNQVPISKQTSNYKVVWNSRFSIFISVQRKLNHIIINNNKVAIEKLKTKMIYNFFVSLISQDVNMLSWQNDIGGTVIWKDIWLLTTRRSIENKLRVFQWKFLHKRCVNNYKLYKWKKRENELCDYCGLKDTTRHRYYDCRVAKKLWESIELILKKLFNFQSKILLRDIVVGIDHRKAVNDELNFIMLIAKWAIHKFRCTEQNESRIVALLTTELKTRNITIM